MLQAMLGDSMPISVVIPTLGERSSLLFEAVESVFQQKETVFELIVVVANPENYTKVAGEIGLKAIVIAAESSLSASKARNLGASHAKYEYLAFLDDDDFWDAAYLHELKKEISKNNCRLWIGSLYSIDSSKKQKIRTQSFTLNDLYLYNPGITGSNIVIARSLFWEIGGFPVNLSVSHDKAIVIEALKLGNKYRLVNEAKAFSRNHSGKRLTSPTSQLNGYIEFYNVYSKEMPEYVCKQLEKKILAFAKNHMVSLFGTQRRLNILGVFIILLRYLQK